MSSWQYLLRSGRLLRGVRPIASLNLRRSSAKDLAKPRRNPDETFTFFDRSPVSIMEGRASLFIKSHNAIYINAIKTLRRLI